MANYLPTKEVCYWNVSIFRFSLYTKKFLNRSILLIFLPCYRRVHNFVTNLMTFSFYIYTFFYCVSFLSHSIRFQLAVIKIVICKIYLHSFSLSLFSFSFSLSHTHTTLCQTADTAPACLFFHYFIWNIFLIFCVFCVFNFLYF
jgi:hypothetical protein